MNKAKTLLLVISLFILTSLTAASLSDSSGTISTPNLGSKDPFKFLENTFNFMVDMMRFQLGSSNYFVGVIMWLLTLLIVIIVYEELRGV